MKEFRGAFQRIYLPYAFVHIRTVKAKWVFLPLNRNYKPLGQLTNDWVIYEDCTDKFISFPSDPYNYSNVWTNIHGSFLWLYTGTTDEAYFERLKKLATYKTKIYVP